MWMRPHAANRIVLMMVGRGGAKAQAMSGDH